MRAVTAALMTAVLATGLGGCALLGVAQVASLRLEVGECVDNPVLFEEEAEQDVETLPRVDCADPHDGEVYHVEDVESDSLPADVAETAEQACYEAYEGFVGIAYEDSVYYFSALYPTEDSWQLGDRQIACVITGDIDVKFEGSLAGVGE
ncbi:septum formation family protein [Demequina iriomotensis]|uniref:septum formation family protein n=1 Tax=Demequina iriomotensis TaxID=1536641 RepID=UPI0007856FDE|nr:septum formation family protein [Demequina iriomotensis]